MIQSVAGLSRFRKYRSPSIVTRSKVEVLLPSAGWTGSREVAAANSSVTGLLSLVMVGALPWRKRARAYPLPSPHC